MMELVAELTIRDARAEGARDLEALLVEHQRMVYRIAFSLLRNHHDAEDAAQETFLRVWRASDKLPGIADRKAWIARIAWNAASDRRRARVSAGEQDRGPRRARFWRGGVEEIAGMAAAVLALESRGADAEQLAAGSELQRLLEALIAGLPKNLRQVLELSTVEELDSAEVGRIVGLSPAAVRGRVFQARQILREKLERLLGRRVS